MRSTAPVEVAGAGQTAGRELLLTIHRHKERGVLCDRLGDVFRGDESDRECSCTDPRSHHNGDRDGDHSSSDVHSFLRISVKAPAR